MAFTSKKGCVKSMSKSFHNKKMPHNIAEAVKVNVKWLNIITQYALTVEIY